MSYFIHPKHCNFCSVALLCLLWSGTVEASVYATDLAVIRRTLIKDIMNGKCLKASGVRSGVFNSSADSSVILEPDCRLVLWVSPEVSLTTRAAGGFCLPENSAWALQMS